MTEDWIDIQRDDAHCRRERQRARSLRASAWWKAQLAKGVCHYCGKKLPPQELTMDHLIPVVRGGTSTRGNVVPCCKECNSRKKYLTPAEQLLQELDAQSLASDSLPEQS